jgi:hypothetical protein
MIKEITGRRCEEIVYTCKMLFNWAGHCCPSDQISTASKTPKVVKEQEATQIQHRIQDSPLTI